MTAIDNILKDRGSKYGSFEDTARIWEGLKDFMHQTKGWARLRSSQRASVDMIAHKIARILNGHPDNPDSWVDIAGYAKLVSDELEEPAESK